MGHRIERLSSEMRKSIITIITNELDNPDIASLSFDISQVNLAADLKTAKVFVRIFSDKKEEKEKIFNAIKSSGAFIKRCLAREFSDIRTVPTLTFVMDNAMAHSEKIDALLREIKKNEESN